MFFKQKSVEVPVGVDWSQRAFPVVVANNEVGVGRPGYFKRLKQVKGENAAFLKASLAQAVESNGGRVVAYHGTTTENAEKIMANGFENHINEEGFFAVSGWHEAVALEGIRFAQKRSQEANADDEGLIVEMAMHNPQPDLQFARLQWLADAANTEPLRVYTSDELRQYVGSVSMSNIHIAPAGITAPHDPEIPSPMV